MKELVLDVETTGATDGTKGNPFSEHNWLCYVGLFCNNSSFLQNIEYDRTPYGERLEEICSKIVDSDIIIGFNIKFDFNWLRIYEIKEYKTKRIWDCQLFEFIVSRQNWKYPSLNDCLEFRGLPPKLDVVKTEYWDKGIDTDKVPKSILEEYLDIDLKRTYSLYKKQMEVYETLSSDMKQLIRISMQDVLTLQEIEFNGLFYDFALSRTLSEENDSVIETLTGKLNSFIDRDDINWGSHDHISRVLYGGPISFPCINTYKYTYADGKTKDKTRKGTNEVRFEQLVEPLSKTELKKPGFFKTGEEILEKLYAKGKAKKIIKSLLNVRKLKKLNSTYYEGFINIYNKMGWTDHLIHGNMNQCVAVSGRLSSTKPNKQNLPLLARQCVITRFGNE